MLRVHRLATNKCSLTGIVPKMSLAGIFITKMHGYAAAKGKTLQVWVSATKMACGCRSPTELYVLAHFRPQEGFKSDVPGETPGGAAPSTVAIPRDVVVSPFDCNIYVPPALAKDGYKIINSAWTPLCKCYVTCRQVAYTDLLCSLRYTRSCCSDIAAHGRVGMHHPLPPELIYRWNPWLFGSVIHSLEW